MDSKSEALLLFLALALAVSLMAGCQSAEPSEAPAPRFSSDRVEVVEDFESGRCWAVLADTRRRQDLVLLGRVPCGRRAD